MADRDYHLHDGKRGVALAIRVIPRARKNQIADLQNDGSIKIRLSSPAVNEVMNKTLIEFLAEVLNIEINRIEIVAGEKRRTKLVSIMDMESDSVQKKILEKLE